MSTFKIRLDVRQRSNYLSARCGDVPGLHVVGSDLAEVRKRAMPAIRQLLKANRSMDVEVLPTDDLAEFQIRVLLHA